MCRLCETKPVYEFTNKRKLCRTCFVRWFEKKFLYIVRKFALIKQGDIVGFKKANGFRDVVLEEVLKMFSENGVVEIVEIGSASPHLLIATNRALSRFSVENLNRKENLINNFNNVRAKRGKFPAKIAISSTTDLEADEIISVLMKGKISDLKKLGPIEKIKGKKIIKPLYLFLDKEVLLYATLKKLKFKKISEKNDKVSLFIDDLEKKHPEVKQAVVKSYLGLFW